MNFIITGKNTCFHDSLLCAGIPNHCPQSITWDEAKKYCKDTGLKIEQEGEFSIPDFLPVIVFYERNGIGHAEYHDCAAEIFLDRKIIGLIVNPLKQYQEHLTRITP